MSGASCGTILTLVLIGSLLALHRCQLKTKMAFCLSTAVYIYKIRLLIIRCILIRFEAEVEALLLTLDVIAIILLSRGVKRVSLSNKPEDLGWFSYSERKINRNKK